MLIEALDLALVAFREPARVAEMRERGLPDDVGQVIRLAGGESSVVESAVARTGEPEDTLKEASVFYLQQVLFAPTADSYRVLGAAADAPQERLREHYRWLMKWLHPDRNQDGWEAIYADRVNVAWQDLKTPERRMDYDRSIANDSHPSGAMVLTAAPLRVRPANVTATAGPLLSGNTVRKLPAIIFGALGLSAAAVIGLMYWAQQSTERELAARRGERSAPVVTQSVAETAPFDRVASGVDLADAAEQVSAVPSATPSSTPEAGNEPAPALPAAAALPSAVAAAPTPPTPTALAPVTAIEVAAAVEPAPIAPEQVVPVVVAATQNPVAAPPPSTAPGRAPATADRAVAAAPAAQEPTRAVASAAPSMDARTVAEVATSVPQRAAPVVAAAAPAVAPSQRAPVVASTDAPAKLQSAPRPSATESSSTRIPVQTEAPSPVAAASVVAPPPAAQPAPPADVGQAVVREFTSAYAAGNLARFDRLFVSGSAPSAVSGMRQRMQSAQMRYLELGSIRWDEHQGQARALAKYRDTYVPRGEKRATTEAGLLELRLQMVAGVARIAVVDLNGGFEP